MSGPKNCLPNSIDQFIDSRVEIHYSSLASVWRKPSKSFPPLSVSSVEYRLSVVCKTAGSNVRECQQQSSGFSAQSLYFTYRLLIIIVLIVSASSRIKIYLPDGRLMCSSMSELVSFLLVLYLSTGQRIMLSGMCMSTFGQKCLTTFFVILHLCGKA